MADETPDARMERLLRTLPPALRGMGFGDPDDVEYAHASDVVAWAIKEIARLREERRSITTLLGKVETLEADNARLRAERRWIPVGERLPEYAEKVLWLWSYGGSFVFPFDGIPPERATHWQPLPPGPEAAG